MTYEALLAFFDTIPFVSIFIVLSCEGKVLSRCRRERGFFLPFFVGGCLGCVSIFFFSSRFGKGRARQTVEKRLTFFFRQNTSKRTTTTVRSFSRLAEGKREKERERERERRTRDTSTRGSNARRIATMTAAEDVQTRPLTEYIFGFFSL